MLKFVGPAMIHCEKDCIVSEGVTMIRIPKPEKMAPNIHVCEHCQACFLVEHDRKGAEVVKYD